MRLEDFDFDLPEARIALRPVAPRDAARLLVIGRDGPFDDRRVGDLPALLRAGDVLVFNDTRVLSARLTGLRRRGASSARIEATLLKRTAADRWTAFARPGKRLAMGDRIRFGEALDATVSARGDGGEIELAFDLGGAELDHAIAATGAMPLPPYIASKRAQDARDRHDYQTVFARVDGSVAAPTAGLHFTPELLERLAAAGIGSAFVTLHVGAGTFLPVKVEAIDDHRMHAESGEVTLETAGALNAARGAGGRIVCVGTTALRLLESAVDPAGRIAAFAGETDIFIRPGYAIRAADALLTNFHLPKSTLLMLVAALAGHERVRAAYAHAIAAGYRFYSYGDASLWFGGEAR